MLATKTTKVSQKRWVKGVNAAATAFAQPPGSFPRGSNMVYSRRGGLLTVDGSLILSAFGGLLPIAFNPLTSQEWLEFTYYNPSTFIRNGFYGLLDDPTTHLSGSTGTPTLSAVGTGLTGTYRVKITAVDGTGGESAASAEAGPITLTNQGLHVVWAAVANAYGYNVYVTSGASGTEVLWLPASALATGVGVTVPGGTVTSVTIDGTYVANANQTPPSTDTSSETILTAIPTGGWSSANYIKTFPASVGVVPTQAVGVGVDTGSAPVVTTTQIRPTTAAQGGPNGGANPFEDTSLAYDNNFTTFSLGFDESDEAGNPGPGAEETWSGFPGSGGGTITAMTVNVNALATVFFGGHGHFFIQYSLDNGVHWRTLSEVDLPYPATTYSASIPVTQDTTQVKVAAYVQAFVGKNISATLKIFETWIAITKEVSAGGSSAGGGLGTGGGTPNGGVQGICSPLPQIVEFTNKMILALGNGFPPYQSDGSSAGTIALVNNFAASYASRTASTVQNVGDQIEVNVGGTNYVFTATQAGTTGSGGAPAFSAVLGSIVADGTVYWKNTGAVAAVTPPRGAAHAIVYAGSLWVLNTSPITTSDNFDGPSCLKMSDLNNPNSYNPLNVAFLDRDDGTEGMGLATFTIAESGIPPVGSLVAFKNFSTFQINGVFGASNFSIARAQTDMGCVAPRSIQFVPGFGIVRLTHLGFAMFDGVRDRLLSEEIRPYLFGGEPDIAAIDWGIAWFAKGAQVTSPPMFVCACPLVGDGAALLNLLAGIAGSAQANVSSTLSSGSYFAQVGLRGPNGVTSLSAIIGPFSITAGATMLQVTTAALPAGYYGFRVWFGTSVSQLNQYVDADTTTINIAAPGSGGTPPLGVPGSMTRLFCYDLVLKAWAIVDLPFSISVLHQIRIPGQQPQTTSAGFYDTTLRRLFAGDGTWDGVPVQWMFRTPEVFGKNASDRVYFREQAIRGVGSPAGVTTTITVNGIGGPAIATRNVITVPMGGGEFAGYADIGISGMDAHADIRGSGIIEIQSVDWFAVAKAIRGRVRV